MGNPSSHLNEGCFAKDNLTAPLPTRSAGIPVGGQVQLGKLFWVTMGAVG